MSLAFQAIFTNKNPISSSSSSSSLSSTHLFKPPNSQFPPPNSTTHFPILTSQHHISLLKLKRINASFDDVYRQADSSSNLDSFLSILEFLSLGSSAAISSYAALSYGASRGGILGWAGNKIFVWQCVFLVAGVTVGAAIRRRQWRRVSGGSYGADYSGRVEKLEEDLRSSATLIRVSSKHLDKLGVRVRATRISLKEPISESAGVAQKKSESTRALAAQEDILAKELGELQKLLLAMQEQQQKQLQLILAIGKAANQLNITTK